jgi:hypothetical protein
VEKSIEEFEKEIEKVSRYKIKAMIALLKLREEYGAEYLKKKRGAIRNKDELRKLAEACKLNWKFMEEVGIIRRINNKEIIIAI